MQKTGAQYFGKKLYDHIMAPPPEPVQVADDEGAPGIPSQRCTRHTAYHSSYQAKSRNLGSE
jgi:hypothetical protein